MPDIIKGQSWWWRIINSAPLKDLLFTMLVTHLLLVEALECTVVSLVEAPLFMHWEPVAVKLVSNEVIAFDGAFQSRSVSNIELVPFVPQFYASHASLLNSFRCQVYIMPACKPIF